MKKCRLLAESQTRVYCLEGKIILTVGLQTLFNSEETSVKQIQL